MQIIHVLIIPVKVFALYIPFFLARVLGFIIIICCVFLKSGVKEKAS